MTSIGRFLPLPLRRATMLGRWGPARRPDTGCLPGRTPASGTRPPVSLPGGLLVSMRSSAWKCCSVSASIADASDGARAADGCRDSDTVSRARSRAVRDMRRRIAEGPHAVQARGHRVLILRTPAWGRARGVAIHIAGCGWPPFWIAPRRVAGEVARSRRNSWIARGWPRFRVRTRVCKTGRAGPFKEGNAACPRRSRS